MMELGLGLLGVALLLAVVLCWVERCLGSLVTRVAGLILHSPCNTSRSTCFRTAQ